VAGVKALYLIDKSALARMPIAAVAERLTPILEAGEAATCDVIDLEVLYSARSHEEYEKIRQRRALAYHSVPIAAETLKRALAVQGELAKSGHHRVPIPDLLIAAAAEAAGLTVLHYDRDYEVIAAVTGQPVEWVVERGSL
jgi:predicted nucleic acid-binding protein